MVETCRFLSSFLQIFKSKCSGLEGNGLHRLVCLKTWSPVGSAVWGGYRTSRAWSLVGGNTSLRVDFEVSEAQARPSVCLSLPAA